MTPTLQLTRVNYHDLKRRDAMEKEAYSERALRSEAFRGCSGLRTNQRRVQYAVPSWLHLGSMLLKSLLPPYELYYDTEPISSRSVPHHGLMHAHGKTQAMRHQ